MSTIQNECPADLLPEVVARLAAGETAHLNVGSECLGHCGPNKDCTQCVTDGAPPAWVELAEATCETCGGDTSSEDHPCAKSQRGTQHCNCSMTQDHCHWCGLQWVGEEVVCPDCHQGKPIHTISVPLPDEFARNEDHHNCPECGGFCTLYAAMHRRQCSACNGTGTVEVKAIVRKVLPVYDDEMIHNHTHIRAVAGEAWLSEPQNPGWKHTRITVIGPQPVPGDHIAIIEAVRS